jgi:hypothetical protein
MHKQHNIVLNPSWDLQAGENANDLIQRGGGAAEPSTDWKKREAGEGQRLV